MFAKLSKVCTQMNGTFIYRRLVSNCGFVNYLLLRFTFILLAVIV